MPDYKKLYPKTYELIDWGMGSYQSSFEEQLAKVPPINFLPELLELALQEDTDNEYVLEPEFKELISLAISGNLVSPLRFATFFYNYYLPRFKEIYQEAHDERYSEQLSKKSNDYEQEVINSVN